MCNIVINKNKKKKKMKLWYIRSFGDFIVVKGVNIF